jgi:hypothetical protein
MKRCVGAMCVFNSVGGARTCRAIFATFFTFPALSTSIRSPRPPWLAVLVIMLTSSLKAQSDDNASPSNPKDRSVDRSPDVDSFEVWCLRAWNGFLPLETRSYKVTRTHRYKDGSDCAVLLVRKRRALETQALTRANGSEWEELLR